MGVDICDDLDRPHNAVEPAYQYDYEKPKEIYFRDISKKLKIIQSGFKSKLRKGLEDDLVPSKLTNFNPNDWIKIQRNLVRFFANPVEQKNNLRVKKIEQKESKPTKNAINLVGLDLNREVDIERFMKSCQQKNYIKPRGIKNLEKDENSVEYENILPNTFSVNGSVFHSYFTKNKDRLRDVLIVDNIPAKSNRNDGMDAAGLDHDYQNGDHDGYDIDMPNFGTAEKGISPFYGNGGLTQLNAPAMTNKKLDFNHRIFEDMFEEGKLVVKQPGGESKLVDFSKYSKPESTRILSMQATSNSKPQDEVEDFDYKQLFLDHAFKGQDIHEIKSFIYNTFIKKIITLRELEFKNMPIIEVEDSDLVIEQKRAEMAKLADKDKHLLQYIGFTRPAFARETDQLRFQMIVRFCLNYYWKKGIGLNHHIIFLCIQHLVNDHGVHLE